MCSEELRQDVEAAIQSYEAHIPGTAARTRKMIAERGEVEALSRLVMSPDLQRGFKVLRDHGELEKSFEAARDRYAHEFPAEAVAAARWRLEYAQHLL